MIIQCKQCRTKFRFDDSYMQGSGVWLRCSRCGHVYFQENPHLKKTETDLLAEPEQEIKPVVAEEKAEPEEKVSKAHDEMPSVFHRDEHGMKSLDKIMAARRRISDEIDLDMEKPPEEKFSDEIEKTEKIAEPGESVKIKIEKDKKKKASALKKSGKAWKIALWSLLVIVVIPGIFYYFVFFAFPQLGEQIIYSSQNVIKIINEYRGVSEPATSGAFINQMVKLQDVRYRRVNNYVLGQIGVLEGTAVNRADYPLSRIQVKGEIVDAYSVVLGERASYAGNILTDEELINLPEEEMLMKLLRPEGLNNSNDKIMPGGQIPFMIVFPNEPSGVIKTTVVTIGAERLLSD
ncbi:MAG: zinc-ribbon domain-containing protein [Deltaproteobacteria bacterium]|nr:zinc-ribbon domain-containing protein [Deltaproteobacteria bacterium]